MANPLLQRLGLVQNDGTIRALFADIQAGRINPRDEVKRRLSGLTPAQKARFQMALPLLRAFAEKYGAGDKIDAVISEL